MSREAAGPIPHANPVVHSGEGGEVLATNPCFHEIRKKINVLFGSTRGDNRNTIQSRGVGK